MILTFKATSGESDSDYYYDLNDEFSDIIPHSWTNQKPEKSPKSSPRKDRKKSKTPRPTTFERKLMERIQELEEKIDFKDPRYPKPKKSDIQMAPMKPLKLGRNFDLEKPHPHKRTHR